MMGAPKRWFRRRTPAVACLLICAAGFGVSPAEESIGLVEWGAMGSSAALESADALRGYFAGLDWRPFRAVVMDERNQPVEGAEVVVKTQLTGWHLFEVPPDGAGRTGTDGIADVRVPVFRGEYPRVYRLLVIARHKDFGRVWGRTSADALECRLVMREGARLRLKPMGEGWTPELSRTFPMVVVDSAPCISQGARWELTEDGVFAASGVVEGWAAAWMAGWAPDDALLFSKPVLFYSEPGKSFAFDCAFEPGARLEGRLDDSVGRPVRGGVVWIRVVPSGGRVASGDRAAPDEKAVLEHAGWPSWREIAADGTFVFEGLPPGEARVVARCEGHVSLADRPRGYPAVLEPRAFELRGGMNRLEVGMEGAASLEVEVSDPEGRPVAGAMLDAAPQARWRDDLSARLVFPAPRAEDFVDAGVDQEAREALWPAYQEMNPETLPVTDARGIVRVDNLFPGTTVFSVWKFGYEMESDEAGGGGCRQAVLGSGETGRYSVRLRAKDLAAEASGEVGRADQ